MEASLKDRAEELARQIAEQSEGIEDLNGLFRSMMGTAIRTMLDAELDLHLATPETESSDTKVSPAGPRNRRNGSSKKTLKSDIGEVTVSTPRDRDGTFEPQLVGKHQRRLEGFDEKVMALYAKGMTTRDIAELVNQLYSVDISADLVSRVTARLDEEVNAWRSRRLSAVWPVVFFDGIVVHVRGSDGTVSPHTAYVALGVNLSGKRELLGLWLARNEGAKFWLSCLTDLSNRGLKDILIACNDGLSGFPEAIRAAFPETRVQLCVVHLVRAAMRYVADKHAKEVLRDLKTIYRAATARKAEAALEAFAGKWDELYPTISRSWRQKWPDIAAMYEFPEPIRKAIYTTNAIESVNSVIGKLSRNRKQYPSEESAIDQAPIAEAATIPTSLF